VAKTSHVIEEVVVGRQASERTETINETLRGTDVEVEHVGAGDAGFKSMDPELPAGVRNVDGTSTVTPARPA
jgi:stress response protein YsnF